MRKSSEHLKYLAFITQVGITMITPIVLCMLGTIYLSRRFQWGQWVIILGILLGISAGVLNVYKMMMSTLKKNENNDKNKKI